MFNNIITKFSDLSYKKKSLIEKNIFSFLALAILTGIYVGFSNLFAYSVAGPFFAVNSPLVKLIISVLFPVALVIVIFSSTELFTSNTMYMSIGILEKKVRFIDYVKVLILSYIGNLIGSVLVAYILKLTGLLDVDTTINVLLNYANHKIDANGFQILIKGIFCNIMVCITVFMCYKTENDVAKILIVIYGIALFLAAGFEHCVANMSLFSMAYFGRPTEILLNGIFKNLLFATIGNIIGGSMFIGYIYWYINSKTKEIYS